MLHKRKQCKHNNKSMWSMFSTKDIYYTPFNLYFIGAFLRDIGFSQKVRAFRLLVIPIVEWYYHVHVVLNVPFFFNLN